MASSLGIFLEITGAFQVSTTSSIEWNFVFRNFQKENLAWHIQIFENFFPKVFLPFNFAPGIFRTFG